MTLDDPSHRFLRGPKASEALRIIARLRDAGFTSYLAGGCVRDALLGQPPKDYDVATDATPDSVRQLFGKSRTLAFGASFGVIGVLPPHGRGRSTGAPADLPPLQPTEVATFRSDGFYSDGRRPDSVHFGDAKNDAMRRDFTINGLFFDPHTDEMIDFIGGQADLDAGILRTIGDPLARFGEDKLRMLRAVRFATTLGFAIEASTLRAIIEHADDIKAVSGERIGTEMRRVIEAEKAASGLRHLIVSGLHRTVLPDAAEMDLDRAESLLLNATPDEFSLRLACLLTLVSNCDESLRAVARSWRLSNEETRRTAAALRSWRQVTKTRSVAWSEIQPILVDRDAEAIVGLAGAIAAVDHSDGDPSGAQDVSAAREALSWPIERLNPQPLLTGNDLRDLGLPIGPQYQSILQATRRDQLDGKIQSKAEAIARLDLDQG